MSAFGEALSELRRAQKPKRGVSLYSRFINRPLGRVLAAACYSARLRANQVTAISALVTAIGLAVLIFAPASWWRGLVVAALLILGFALDSADGQVSRLTQTSSKAGEWLDHVTDAGKMVAVHAAVLVALYLTVPSGHLRPWTLSMPLAYQLVAVVTFAGGVIAELLSRIEPTEPKATRAPSTVTGLALLPADFGILALSFVLLAWPAVYLTLYALLLLANLLIAILLAARWLRALS